MSEGLDNRFGLAVPNEWWPSSPLLKSCEAAGFALVQIPSPPPSVLADARQLSRHATAVRAGVETRSLARLAARAERLEVTIAIENLAPVHPGPERLSHTPLTLRSLAHRIGSPRLGLCLDLGHAHVVAELKHTRLERLVEPALDAPLLLEVHPPNRPQPDELFRSTAELLLAPRTGSDRGLSRPARR
jgi:hypothetical protein